MGTVFRARDPRIGGRVVAIKLLKGGLDNPELQARFKQEADAAGVLEHDNIVRILDVGDHQDQPFIAMEYIDGETLADKIVHEVRLELATKLQLMEELCDGLAYAHSFKIVHRDIKPPNLMVERRRGRLKILDFGIAKLSGSGMTRAGAFLGTLNYMSPEQVDGRPDLDHRSDIFSVGAVFYELLTYRRAFPGNLRDRLLERILSERPEPITVRVPDIDPEIERIVFHALEKDPADRFQDLETMRREVAVVRKRFRAASGPHRIPMSPAAEARPAVDRPQPSTNGTGEAIGSTLDRSPRKPVDDRPLPDRPEAPGPPPDSTETAWRSAK